MFTVQNTVLHFATLDNSEQGILHLDTKTITYYSTLKIVIFKETKLPNETQIPNFSVL